MKIDFTSSEHLLGTNRISTYSSQEDNVLKPAFAGINCCPDLTMHTEIFKLENTGSQKEPIVLNVKPNSLVIILNTDMSLNVFLGKEEKQLGAFEYVIVNGNEHLPITALPQKNQKFKTYVLAINSEAVKKVGCSFFEDNFIYSNFYNLRVAEHVRYLDPEGEKASEMMSSLGHAHLITGMLFELFTKHQNEEKQPHTSLRKWELDQLLKISTAIEKKPEDDYRVDDLAKQTGINIPRLQKGFKEMHGHTVADFIREIRLKKAEELFRTTDLNVSEVVYSVGLTSRSYFSRIFKKKYHCSPSQYQREKNLSRRL